MLTHGLLPVEKLEKVRSQLGVAGTGVEASPDTVEDEAVAERPVCSAVSASGVGDLAERVARLEERLAAALERLDAIDGGSE